MDLRKLELRFRGHEADLIIEDLILNGSDIQNKTTFSLLPSSVFNILNAQVSSRYFNLDRVLMVVERAMKYMPQANSSAPSSAPADIPVVIHNGRIDFARIITGNIDLRNTISRISMRDNIFKLHNLRTNAFNGNIFSLESATPTLLIKYSSNSNSFILKSVFFPSTPFYC